MAPEEVTKINLISGRRVGNSTRIVDALVQDLFTKGECYYWDHADREDNNALEHTLNILTSRLHNEHHIHRKDYNINYKERKITLYKQYI